MNILKKNDKKQFELNLPWVDLLIAGLLGALITAIVLFFTTGNED